MRRSGFALLELLVCLFLALCATGLLLPRYFRHRAARELPEAVSVVRRSLERARNQAIAGRREIEVEFDRSGGLVIVRERGSGRLSGRAEKIPPGISFALVSETLEPLVFRPDGSLAGLSGSIILRDRRLDREERLIVYGLTGRVRLDPDHEWQGTGRNPPEAGEEIGSPGD